MRLLFVFFCFLKSPVLDHIAVIFRDFLKQKYIRTLESLMRFSSVPSISSMRDRIQIDVFLQFFLLRDNRKEKKSVSFRGLELDLLLFF